MDEIKQRIEKWVDDMYGDSEYVIAYAEHLTPSTGINNPLAVNNHPFVGYELVTQHCSPATKGQKPAILFNFYKKGSR